MNDLDYCLNKLAEAKVRMAENHRKCEETALLMTPDGIAAYQLARGLHESDRKQVFYWTAQAEKAVGGSRAA